MNVCKLTIYSFYTLIVFLLIAIGGPRVEFGKFTLTTETIKDNLVRKSAGKFECTTGSLRVHRNYQGLNLATASISGYLNQ